MTWHERADDLNPLIETATHATMRKFYKFVDREDVRQECVMWCLTHPGKTAEYLREKKPGALVTAMENAASKFCQKEKAAAIGYKVDDLYFWTEGAIRDVLTQFFRHGAAANPPQPQGEKSSGEQPPNEGGNWLASLADVGVAFAKLDDKEKWVLAQVFGEQRTQRWVAQMCDVSDQTIHTWIERSIRKMHRELGGDRPAPHRDCGGECTGTRKVMSNAAANALTRSQYDD